MKKAQRMTHRSPIKTNYIISKTSPPNVAVGWLTLVIRIQKVPRLIFSPEAKEEFPLLSSTTAGKLHGMP
jgi:hypothetical protein